MSTFRELLEGSKISSRGVTVTFKGKADEDEAIKLINAYDSQTWAIDSNVQQKKAMENNKTIIKMLANLGKGELSFKSGPMETVNKIKF